MDAIDDKPLILVAEDEAPLSEVLTYNLEKSGFATVAAFDGVTALQHVTNLSLSAVILDWMMPGMSGIDVCRAIRANARTANLPILMLTARGDEADRVHGLEAGADDYMVKPFSPRELIARMHALLRRTRAVSSGADLACGPLAINMAQHKVSVSGKSVRLGPTEYRLLKFFMENPGRVYSREVLMDRVWSNGVNVESRTVDVHVRRLRKTLMDAGSTDPIRTVRGAGYSLDIDSRQA
ncbi:MAG: phosphate regulon transcriptional regulator PhoB [Rhodospirillales bacterium]|nr:phosphate regulon transcriptional regulator PhoB [Rhodospirillales bacterium]